MSSLLMVASASLIIPATLYAAIADADAPKHHPSAEDPDILLVSRGTSIILLILYILYLYFQLKSHANLFDEEVGSSSEGEGQNDDSAEGGEDNGDKKEGDTLSPWAAGVALIIITVLVALCAEFLVDSIDSIVEKTGISKTFIGLILLPIVGNAAEHVTAVVVSYKNKMNLALGVAIGSSLQIAMFVTPFLVMLGWIIGSPMTLKFQMFETVVFFISVLIVNYLMADGRRYVVCSSVAPCLY
jgi:Ca2+:H+ antiporter